MKFYFIDIYIWYFRIKFKGDDKWIKGMVKGFMVEGGFGLVVVDLVDVFVEYVCV